MKLNARDATEAQIDQLAAWTKRDRNPDVETGPSISEMGTISALISAARAGLMATPDTDVSFAKQSTEQV